MADSNDNTISGNFTRELLLGTDADEAIDGAGSSDIVDGSGGNDSIKGGDASVRDQWTGNHDILIGGGAATTPSTGPPATTL